MDKPAKCRYCKFSSLVRLSGNDDSAFSLTSNSVKLTKFPAQKTTEFISVQL